MYYYNTFNRSAPVHFDSEHPLYKENLELWLKCRDCYKGEEEVKKKNQRNQRNQRK